MRTRLVIFAGVVLALSSCFLKQEPPVNNTSGASGRAEGLVMLEEMKGDSSSAAIAAIFGRMTDDRQFRQEIAQLNLGITLPAIAAFTEARAPQCKVKRKPRAEESEESERGTKMISMGKLRFGPAQFSLDEDADHRYFKQIEPSVPMGLYQVTAEGDSDVKGFDETLSMPESLLDVKANGTNGGEGVIAISKSTPLQIEWKSPAVSADRNFLLVDLYTDTADETVQLHCLGMEKDFPVENGQRQWQLPVSYLSQLGVTTEAELFLVRAHARAMERSDLNVEFQGLRSFYMKASVE